MFRTSIAAMRVGVVIEGFSAVLSALLKSWRLFVVGGETGGWDCQLWFFFWRWLIIIIVRKEGLEGKLNLDPPSLWVETLVSVLSRPGCLT